MTVKDDPYVYVRNYYNVPAYIGVAVAAKSGGHNGVIVKPKHPDQYVHVLVDGDKHVRNHHPLELTYKPIGCEAVTR